MSYMFDADGCAFWRLTSYGDGDDVLLQDVGTRDPFTSSDEWYQYGAEKKEAVEKYCSSVRTRDLMSETLSQTLPSSSGSKEEVKIENATTGSREEDIPKSSAEEYCIQEVYIFYLYTGL